MTADPVVIVSYARTPMAEAFVKVTRAPEDVAYAELTRGVPMKRLAYASPATTRVGIPRARATAASRTAYSVQSPRRAS